jgi:Metal binding domain of Ada
MQMKPITAIVVLLLVATLISVAGCTSSSSTSTATPTVQAKAVASVKATVSAIATTATKTTSTKTPTATPSPTIQANGPFYYSTASTTKVYHYSWCQSVKQIKASNLGTFSSSAEARAAGYHPCSICNPP